MWIPGPLTGKIAKTALVSALVILTVLGSIGTVLPGIVQALAPPSSPSTVTQSSQCPLTAPNATISGSCSSPDGGSAAPQSVGSDMVQNPRLPRTVMSSVSSLIGTGGVIQSSPQNLTLYNSVTAMRLLGGSRPHDELLGTERRVLSSWSFWSVEGAAGNLSAWVPLVPRSSDFSVLGTNRTGTYVVRSMQVTTGQFSGTLRVAYKATAAGPLKWDLEFTPASLGHYRLVYTWLNLSATSELLSGAKSFRAGFGVANYTLAWSDVPPNLNVTTTATPSKFSLSIDLGQLSANYKVTIDPSIVSNSRFQGATDYSAQRKVVYDPKGGNYFVFYSNGSAIGYSSSSNGNTWSSMQSMPNGWPQFTDSASSLPSVASYGQRVVAAAGNYLAPSTCLLVECIYSVSLSYSIGTISGNALAWGPVQQIRPYSATCPHLIDCYLGVRLVHVAISPNGDIVFSYNAHWGFQPSSEQSNEVDVAYLRGSSTYWAQVDSYPGAGAAQFYSNVLPEGDPNNGVVRIIYEHQDCCGTRYLQSRTYSSVSNTLGTVDQIAFAPDNDEFSVASDAEYGVHLVYLRLGVVNYLYHAAGSPWTTGADVFRIQPSPNLTYPTVTVDLSTDTVYVFALLPVVANNSTVIMRSKSPSQDPSWFDATTSYQFKNRILPTRLGSSLASASATNTSSIALVWTEGNGPYNVTFGAIPIQTVWSPYNFPTNPWDGNGLAPNGQYSQSLTESVSPSTGSLTVVQNDLEVPGRGINFGISRVFTGTNVLYSQAPIGNGWQLNLPSFDAYSNEIHLWNGQSYSIPTCLGAFPSCVWENHQGEHFRLASASGVDLTTSSGLIYHFDCFGSCYWRLSRITDATGNNVITFGHSGPYYDISSTTDTLGRQFLFCYDLTNIVITSIEQAGGSCGHEVGPVRKISYSYNGNLASVTDPANRTTSFQYNAAGGISQVTYSTGGYSSYAYQGELMGNGATGYRVSQQSVYSSSGALIRKFTYTYHEDSGTDQVTRSTVAAYNGTSTLPAAYTDYAFSFIAVKWNVSDANHAFLRGVVQFFGVQGTIPKETIITTDGSGHFGSFTNFYSYDLWGNQIYSRRVINPSASWYHESFNAYYNNGLPPAFNAFQDTFSQNQRTAPNNPWSVKNGYWMVRNGLYNGTETPGSQEDILSSVDIGKSDISIQAAVYVNKQVNNTAGQWPRIGIFARYNQMTSKSYKWALVLVNTGGVTYLELLDEWNVWLGGTAKTACPITTGWYSFNLTIHDHNATGTAGVIGQTPCPTVSGVFPVSSPASSGTAFGLYAGGYSALFANVTVTTVSPSITKTGFSNSFIQKGAPGSNVHGALAGAAELQNGTGSAPIETYYSYTSPGRLYQTEQLYTPVSGVQWLTTSRTYDTYGNLIGLIDPRGNNITYAYSSTYSYAYLTSRTQTLIPGNTVITNSYTYNFTMGTMLSSVDPNVQTTTYQYDALGRVTRVNYPNGLGFVSYAYNDQANFVDVTNENGLRTRQVYDGLGRLSTVERFSGSSFYSNQTYTYNWMDKIATRTDPLHNVYSYQYDVLGRTRAVVKPDGNVISTLYQDLDPSVKVTDENGYWKTYGYDRLGRLLWVQEWQCPPLKSILCQRTTVYSYDEAGNLRTMTTSNSQSTAYKYDNLNRLTSVNYPDGTSESYSYDNNGNLVVKTDRKSLQASYAYDSLDRIASITYPGSTSPDSYTYDSNSNLLQLRSQNATLTYGYDGRNRVLGETYTINNLAPPPGGGGGGGKGCPCKTSPTPATASSGSTPTGTVYATYTVSYVYNGETLSSIGYPDGRTVTYSYDNLGRVQKVSNSTINYATFSYYQNDQIKGVGFGNGLVANYTYDVLARPQNITVYNGTVKLLSFLYAYNKTGTVASVNGQINAVAVSEQYRYDPIQRLTNATLTAKGKTTTIWYEYDDVGNRLRQSLNGITTYSYNRANNELTLATISGISTAYSYDLDGNLNVTTSGTAQSLYYWDVPGHLLKVSNGGGVQGFYAYDGMGRRVEAKEGSSTTFYAYQGTDTLYEQPVSGAVNDYVYAGGMRIARLSGVAVNYFHTDALGSTRLVTDSSKTVLFTDSYQPFGQDNSSTGNENYKFTGKPVSQTTGLYYYYERWYDPSVGRFVSEDSLPSRLSDPQSSNKYVYANNSPATFTDPSGGFAVMAGNGRLPCWDWFGLLPCHQGGTAGAVSTITTTSSAGGPEGPLIAIGVIGIYVGGSALYNFLSNYFASNPPSTTNPRVGGNDGNDGTTPSPTGSSTGRTGTGLTVTPPTITIPGPSSGGGLRPSSASSFTGDELVNVRGRQGQGPSQGFRRLFWGCTGVAAMGLALGLYLLSQTPNNQNQYDEYGAVGATVGMAWVGCIGVGMRLSGTHP